MVHLLHRLYGVNTPAYVGLLSHEGQGAKLADQLWQISSDMV